MHADVEGLLALPRLSILVMGHLQPVVVLHTRSGGSPPHDFAWLQRLLKQHSGVRLTSNELAYQLESKGIFDVPPLPSGGTA